MYLPSEVAAIPPTEDVVSVVSTVDNDLSGSKSSAEYSNNKT